MLYLRDPVAFPESSYPSHVALVNAYALVRATADDRQATANCLR